MKAKKAKEELTSTVRARVKEEVKSKKVEQLKALVKEQLKTK